MQVHKMYLVVAVSECVSNVGRRTKWIIPLEDAPCEVQVLGCIFLAQFILDYIIINLLHLNPIHPRLHSYQSRYSSEYHSITSHVRFILEPNRNEDKTHKTPPKI